MIWDDACARRVDLDIKQHASIENISPSPEVAEAEAKSRLVMEESMGKAG